MKFEDAGDDGVRRFKKLRRHALEGDLERMMKMNAVVVATIESNNSLVN